MGWVTPLGTSLDLVWSRLLAGEVAFQHHPCQHRLRNTSVAAASSASDPEDRLVELCCAALRAACASGNATPSHPALDVLIGTSLAVWTDRLDDDPTSHWVRRVTRELELSNCPMLVSSACSSAADAIGLGVEIVRADREAMVACGGVDVVTLGKRLAHSSLSTLTPSYPRAFDVRRDGMVLGEGAAFLVLAPLDSDRREATSGYILGIGQSNDAAGLTNPDPTGSGVALAIERALADAGVAPSDISVVQAHGSGTPLSDAAEAAALHRVFGADPPMVFATKSALGHSLGATGAIELVSLLLALRSGQAPPNAGLDVADPRLGLTLSRTPGSTIAGRIGASLTLGFGGFNTCIVAMSGEDRLP